LSKPESAKGKAAGGKAANDDAKSGAIKGTGGVGGMVSKLLGVGKKD
jgi:hypothetical protein